MGEEVTVTVALSPQFEEKIREVIERHAQEVAGLQRKRSAQLIQRIANKAQVEGRIFTSGDLTILAAMVEADVEIGDGS